MKLNKAVQFRIARPTGNLELIVRFYRDGLGLEQVGSFKGHDGYDGAMFALNDASCHLEFTSHAGGEAQNLTPGKDSLLVLYFDTMETYQEAVSRLEKLGHLPVQPENPYWLGKSRTYEDPDRYRVVLYNGIYVPH